MKKTTILSAIMLSLIVTICGCATTKEIDGVEYSLGDTYKGETYKIETYSIGQTRASTYISFIGDNAGLLAGPLRLASFRVCTEEDYNKHLENLRSKENIEFIEFTWDDFNAIYYEYPVYKEEAGCITIDGVEKEYINKTISYYSRGINLYNEEYGCYMQSVYCLNAYDVIKDYISEVKLYVTPKE